MPLTLHTSSPSSFDLEKTKIKYIFKNKKKRKRNMPTINLHNDFANKLRRNKRDEEDDTNRFPHRLAAAIDVCMSAFACISSFHRILLFY